MYKKKYYKLLRYRGNKLKFINYIYSIKIIYFYKNNINNIKLYFDNIIDFTYLLEKIQLNKILINMLNKIKYIKFQENIFFKYIISINININFNLYIFKFNSLINLHKYLIHHFPSFTNNTININIMYKELNAQINYIKKVKNIQYNLSIPSYKLLSSIKYLEHIFELYTFKNSINLINPSINLLLNLYKFNSKLYYIEMPCQNLLNNLYTTISTIVSVNNLINLKIFNTLSIGGDTLIINNFSPQLINKYYYTTLINTTNLYKSIKSTSVYMYNLILESLLKQYKYQGIILPSFLFEFIVKRMVNYVYINNPGETSLMFNDVISNTLINLINQSFFSKGFKGTLYTPVLVGISKLSLNHSGLLSSISFQETLKSLSSLVIYNKIDWILDLKSKIIFSDLLNTGTGWYKHYKN